MIHCLLVEDSEDDAILVIRALDKAGIEASHVRVDTEDDMLAALSGAKNFDVVLTDHSMPSFDSERALTTLQASGKDIPLVIVSGSIGESDAIRMMRLGVRDWVPKGALARLPPVITREIKQTLLRREKAQAAKSLVQREQELSDVLDGASDLILRTTASGQILFANKRWYERVGFAPDGESPHEFFSLLAEASIEPAKAAFAQALSGVAVQDLSLCIQGSSGNEVFVDATLSGSEASGTSSILCFLRDTTQHRRAAEKAREYENELVHSRKMEALGRLAGGIAHDFNNLLMVIFGQCELALRRLEDGDPIRDDLEHVLTAGKRGMALTKDLLSISRRRPAEEEDFDVAEQVEELTQMLGRALGEQMSFSIQNSQEALIVAGDRGHFDQVLLNLVINARDAMSGSGEVLIAVERVEVDGTRSLQLVPGSYACVSVSDTGSGMTPEVMQHIFEPFFTTKEEGQGSGQGLATAFGIIKQAGGAIIVTSKVNQGTRFDVYLPLQLGERDKSIDEGAQLGLNLAPTETILVVDDDPQVLGVVATTLENLGYQVLRANDALEANRVFGNGEAVDLLVTDVMMPRVKGPSLWKALLTKKAQLPVLFMSGFLRDPETLQSILRESAAHQFISKPFTAIELEKRVRAVLSASARTSKP